MSAEQMSPPLTADVRAYQSRSGTYLHAADLARMLRKAASEATTGTGPIMALGVNAAADAIERLAVGVGERAS